MFVLSDIPEFSPFSVATAVAILLLVFTIYYLKNKDCPPGPLGLPFLGYYLSLKGEYHLKLAELAKKYGDVYSVNVTGQTYIHLNSSKVLREAHVTKGDCFSARMSSYNVMKYCFENGIAFSEGEAWRTLKKFYVQCLKDQGMGTTKGTMGGPIYDAMTAIIEDLNKTKGETFESVSLLTKHCTAIDYQLLFRGVKISKKDTEDLNDAYMTIMNGMKGSKMMLAGPIAQYLILPWDSTHHQMKAGKQKMRSILTRIVREHESTLDENQPRDIVDMYFCERNARIRSKDPSAKYFTEEELVGSLFQFVGDGAAGIGMFVAVFLNELVDYPEVQEKIYREITEVVGEGRQPSGDDKSRMPYTNAATLEMMRTSSFFPIFPSQECRKETTLNGYKIPKGSMTLVNIWAIQHDPRIYENPDTFDPTRFMNKPGKPKEESPILFGVGKRACAGESFVMLQVFLYLTTIVKNFKLVKPPGQVSNFSAMTGELELKICAFPRSQD